MGKKNKIRKQRIEIKKAPITLANILIYFLIGLFCVLYNKNFPFPASGPRWTLLILTSSSLPLIIILKNYKKLKKYTLNVTLFHILILIFFIWFSLSKIWAIDKSNFIEEWIRNSSMVLLLLFFSFYANKLNTRILTYIFAFVTTIISILGMLQFYGLDGNIFEQTALPASTFVNKNLATPLLSFLLPFLYIPILFIKDKRKVIVLTVGLSISLSYLVIAATRSSWMGVIFSVFLFVIILLNKNIRKKFLANIIKLRFLYILFAFLLMFLLIKIGDYMKYKPIMATTVSAQLESALKFIGKDTKLLKEKADNNKDVISENQSERKQTNNKANLISKEKHQTLYKFSSKSIRMRIAKWRNSFEIVKKTPFMGIGLGSFDAVYPFYHNKILVDEGYQGGVFYGGLHNDIYQYLVELGFIGLSIILVILFLIFKMVFIILKAELSLMDYVFYVSSMIGLIGILTDSIFNYPLRYATYLFIISIIVGKIYSKYFQIKKIGSFFKIKLEKNLVVLLIFFIILSSVSMNIIYRRNMSEKSFKQATIMEGKGRLDKTWYHLKQSIAYWPYRSLYLIYGTAICFENYKVNKTEKSYQEIIKYNNKALENLPYHFIPNFIRINLFMERENWKREKDIDKYAKLLLNVAPQGDRRYRTYQTVANLAYLKEEYIISLELYKILQKRKPNSKEIRKRVGILEHIIAENNDTGDK